MQSGLKRPLFPAPERTDAEETPGPSSRDVRLSLEKRSSVNVACWSCRKKKSRCNGQRPTCQACQAKGLMCEYAAEPGETWSSSLRSKNGRLEKELDSVMELYWRLQNKPISDANEILRLIRLGGAPAAVMATIAQRGMSPMRERPPGPVSPYASESSNPEDASERLLHNRQGQPTAAVSWCSLGEDFLDILRSPNTTSVLGEATRSYFLGAGMPCSTLSEDEANLLLVLVIKAVEENGGDWAPLIYGDTSRDTKAAACMICIMAAIGLHYAGDAGLYSQSESSRENDRDGFVNSFYWLSKTLLGEAIKHDPLEALRAISLLALYNVIAHSTTALVYAELGISLARNHGLNQAHPPPSITESNWRRYKTATMTLVTLRGWLVTTLGYIPRDSLTVTGSIDCVANPEDLEPEEVLQEQMATLTGLSANFMSTVSNFKFISPGTLSTMRQDLQQWHQQLPRWMHLSNLAEPESTPTTSSRNFWRSITLTHLFCLSAYVLVARVIVASQHNQLSLKVLQDGADTTAGLRDGLVGARVAARFLHLLLDENAMFKRCWLCIFGSYESCLMILHSAAHMMMHGHPSPLWREELSYAKKCLDVLEFCSSADSMALRFLDIVRPLYDSLISHGARQHGEQRHSLPSAPQQQQLANINAAEGGYDYLFALPAEGSTLLHETSQEIIRLLSYPFVEAQQDDASPRTRDDQQPTSAEESRLGKLDLSCLISSAFNETRSEETSGVLAGIVSDIRPGRFIGDVEPCGWSGTTPQLG